MYQVMQSCFITTAGIINFSSFIVSFCLTVIPLCALVIYISVQRCSQSSGIPASHLDHFTYHTIINMFVGLTGITLSGCGLIASANLMFFVGLFMFCSSTLAFMLFDTMICAEHYVAVVHPITYRNLKSVKGATMRNVAIGCVWLLSLLFANFMIVKSQIVVVVMFLGVTALCIAIVFFCSLRVLFVLIRPGPGEVGRAKQKVDQSKLRAFYTIVTILVALLVRFGINAFLGGYYTSAVSTEGTKCHLILSIIWMTLPGSMVQPLLFLQRAQWFVCCKNNS